MAVLYAVAPGSASAFFKDLRSGGAGCRGGPAVAQGLISGLAAGRQKHKLGLSLRTMNAPASRVPPGRFAFPNWAARLQGDTSLSPGLREAYRRTVGAFLQCCARRGTPPSVASAREYVELARLEQWPSPGRLQEWKDALNWYFRRGRATLRLIADGRSQIADRGVPALARSDLGTAPWEAALIAQLRQQQRSWRTEQTYRGWLWRFTRWWEPESKRFDTSPSIPLPGRGGEGRTLADVTGAEGRAVLTRLAGGGGGGGGPPQ